MEVTDTIYQIGDSIKVVNHHIVDKSHDLTEYMDSTETLSHLSIESFKHEDWSVVSHLEFESGVIAVLTIILFLLLFICVPKIVPQKIRNRISKISLKWPFLLVWIYGFVVYDVGMCTGECVSLITNAPMAIVYAFKIFLFDSDVSEIHGAFHESWVYSFNFALVHFLAAITSTAFIIKHFGFNMIARFRIWWLSIRAMFKIVRTKDLYVFWGLNDASCIMAKSIEEHYSDKSKKDYITIIIRVPGEDDKDWKDHGMFVRLFNIISIKSSDIEKLQGLNCYVTVTNVNLKTVRLEKNEQAPTDIFKDVLRMKSLRRILKYGVTNKIHILALSDDEKQNLKLTSLLANDVSIEGIAYRAHAMAYSSNKLYEASKIVNKIKDSCPNKKSLHAIRMYECAKQLYAASCSYKKLSYKLMVVFEHVYNKCAVIFKFKRKQFICWEKDFARIQGQYLKYEESYKKFSEKSEPLNSTEFNTVENYSYPDLDKAYELAKQYVAFGVIIYCHARFNSVHRVIEDKMTTPGLQIKVIDSSHVNVELLKSKEPVLPINFVDVTPQGRVSSDFNALVVGFSEVGRDAVKFLYEFGAFVSSKSTKDCVLRSNIHIDVVDNRMKDIAGSFIANTPAIKTSLSFDTTKRNPLSAIELHDMDCNSVAFYDYLKNNINKLNYIVIATENDELNITLAVRIIESALRCRCELEHFCVLVRAHDDEDGHIQEIVSFYNGLINAQGRPIDYNKFNQETVKRTGNEDGKATIFLFGQDKNVFSFDNIINGDLENKALNYKEAYAVASGILSEESKILISKQWHEEFIKYMQLDEQHREFYPTLAGIQKLRRTRSQDFANSLHEQTKKILKDKAFEASGRCTDSVSFSKYSRKVKTATYFPVNESDADDVYCVELLNVLAQTEHLRWNASHEIMGYVFGDETNELKMTHKCLKPWNKFDILKDEVTLSYDYSVVDLTLGINIVKNNTNITGNTSDD